MNLLVIGGCHTYGPGLTTGQSFVEQFIHRLERDKQRVVVDYYAPFTLKTAFTLLPRLSLGRYDLIILQVGNYELQQPTRFSALLQTGWLKTELAATTELATAPAALAELRRYTCNQPEPARMGFRNGLQIGSKLALLRGLALVGCLPRLWAVEFLLANLFHQLRPHRRRVIALTPFPHGEPVSHWLRQQGQRLVQKMGHRNGISVFDTHKHIRPTEEYFLGSHQDHFNAVIHALIGRELYDFYQAEPTILSVLPSK